MKDVNKQLEDENNKFKEGSSQRDYDLIKLNESLRQDLQLQKQIVLNKDIELKTNVEELQNEISVVKGSQLKTKEIKSENSILKSELARKDLQMEKENDELKKRISNMTIEIQAKDDNAGSLNRSHTFEMNNMKSKVSEYDQMKLNFAKNSEVFLKKEQKLMLDNENLNSENKR